MALGPHPTAKAFPNYPFWPGGKQQDSPRVQRWDYLVSFFIMLQEGPDLLLAKTGALNNIFSRKALRYHMPGRFNSLLLHPLLHPLFLGISNLIVNIPFRGHILIIFYYILRSKCSDFCSLKQQVKYLLAQFGRPFFQELHIMQREADVIQKRCLRR